MIKKISSIIFLIGLISACSSVDSTKPFNNEQVDNLIRQNHTTRPAQQRIKIALPNPNNWKTIDISGNNRGPIVLIPDNESYSNWTQKISTKIAGYIFYRNLTLYQFLNNEIKQAENYCEKVDRKILSESSNFIIYQLATSHCYPNQPDRLQVCKAFAGNDAIYALCYTTTGGSIDNEMYSVISKSQLVKNPQYVPL